MLGSFAMIILERISKFFNHAVREEKRIRGASEELSKKGLEQENEQEQDS